MKAMVLAAGRGARLGPLTAARPKALIEVGGRTLLDHVLGRLAAAGVNEVIINLHHLGVQIPQHLERHGGFGIARIAYSEEPILLGTGGGLKKASWFFDDGKPFLIHNADVLSDIDLGALLQAHRDSGALATLAVAARPTARPLCFDADGRLCGRQDSGREDRVREPHGAVSALGFAGIHAVSPAIFAKLVERGAFSITDAYLRLAAAGELIRAHRVDGARWRDCGRPEDLRPL